MKKLGVVVILAIATAMVWLIAPSATTRAEPASDNASPILIELFTSQGCSSCPPADLLMGRLAQEASLLVITRPVTYWDRLGWKDTLAREENTRLQQDYAARKNRGSGVYTPQVVINGGDAAIGSREAEIRQLARWADRTGSPALAVKRAENGGFGAGIAGKSDTRFELMLVALDSRASVAIGRGENSGRKITYTNVVRAERRLGEWRGGTQAYEIAPNLLEVPHADRFALILRQPDGGPVGAAQMLPLTN